MASIFPGEEFYVNIYVWHGFNTELMMTIGVIIILGTIMYMTLKKWGRFYEIFPQKLALNRFIMAAKGLDFGSEKFTRFYMTGFIRDYLVYIFSFFVNSFNWFSILLRCLRY
ncbi:hypothetical protein KHA80_03920 [Anaerobacillus sp. HL2]|nr:hypothetical protein KHA80_03920 [Anaerobacillus sp. HL2]